jgi:DNA-directed RNA polymerase subunit H (RpoH/RPB5)
MPKLRPIASHQNNAQDPRIDRKDLMRKTTSVLPNLTIKKSVLPNLPIKKSVLPNLPIRKSVLPNLPIKKNFLPNIIIRGAVSGHIRAIA